MPTTKSYAATVNGGFWPTNGVGTLTNIPASRSFGRRIAAMMLGGSRLQALRTLGDALNGVAPGALATKTLAAVAATVELGGVRPIVQVPVVNRVTTAADQAEIDDDIWTMSTRTTFGPNPPPNLDRNPLGTR
jgi:hypothetical protein